MHLLMQSVTNILAISAFNRKAAAIGINTAHKITKCYICLFINIIVSFSFINIFANC